MEAGLKPKVKISDIFLFLDGMGPKIHLFGGDIRDWGEISPQKPSPSSGIESKGFIP